MRPLLAADMIVFMTILLASLSSVEIIIEAPAFINKEVIRIIRVPAMRKLMFDAKKVRLQFYLYILKIRTICLEVRFLN